MFFLSIKLALRNLLANKKQSFLTMLGVIIGVMSVVSIMAIGAGAQSLIINQIKKMGTNLVAVVAGKSEGESGPPPIALGIVITSLKIHDVEILAKLPHVTAITPIVLGSGKTVSKYEEDNAAIQGVGSQSLKVHDFKVSQGRFITEKDEQGLRKVVFIGQEIKDKFFPNINPLGQDLRIKNEHFKVIGVLKAKGATLGFNNDNTIFMPARTAQKFLFGIDYIHGIRLKIDEAENIPQVMTDITTLMRRAHGIDNPDKDDFLVRSMAQALDILNGVTDALKLFLATIAGISLLVGGIGIMNMMLVTVTKRTREIGLRKAVGARRVDIINQFLLEAISITFLGGIIGVVMGIVFSALIAWIVQSLDYDWSFIISFNSIMVALTVSVLIGIIFGLYPAIKAARLKPIEALRYQ